MKLSDQMLFGHPILSSSSNDYHDSLFAAEFDIDLDPGGTSVDRILDEFLDHGCRPLHDLARRDLVRKIIR